MGVEDVSQGKLQTPSQNQYTLSKGIKTPNQVSPPVTRFRSHSKPVKRQAGENEKCPKDLFPPKLQSILPA